ncbi:preprotein translocase subunit SecY [Patescibacteria group bacterium]|nr:preprotein translocase subunit SecY [Patescibacteria group bacterium]MBU1246835.1 preprotein translocase subunit SecY [Patescibacteria group bacterium]MBU1519630.1 preprotein translocase subunit SecY [Patescibacteria group bacterium]MBU1730597.1 preprotein translocase subunit SecY [Patescibacteria group bacterium]MBU1956446.1 preprotein translocase subunit SecY [Patescibacteria group bacterium]
MDDFLYKIKLLVNDTNLRKKLLFVLASLVIFRFLSNIPIPAAVGSNLESLLQGNNMLGFMNLLTGGGLSAISIMMLGVGPYITSSIIMQLLTVMSAKLKALYHEEGEAGKKKFTQISRKLTIVLALLQGFGLILYLQTQGAITSLSLFEILTNVIIVAAGSVLLMWIGELITEFGIGNGVSLIIFAGIVSGVPAKLSQLSAMFLTKDIPLYLGFVVLAVLIIAGVVIMTEAERPVPVTYAKQIRGQRSTGGVSTYLPLRISQAGVMPIIFALSLLMFPQMVINFLSKTSNESVQLIATKVGAFLNDTLVSSIIYFVLVFAFTFFYTAVTFDPDAVATNLQKNGAFIPGIRPGKSTSEYIAKILTRITLVGAIFLSLVAILPFILQAVLKNPAMALGGTALLIVVSVVIDLVKKIEAQLSMREY